MSLFYNMYISVNASIASASASAFVPKSVKTVKQKQKQQRVLKCSISLTLESTCKTCRSNKSLPPHRSAESDAMVLNLGVKSVSIENNELLDSIRRSLAILRLSDDDDDSTITFTIVEIKGAQYMIRFLRGPYLTPGATGPDAWRQYSADVEQTSMNRKSTGRRRIRIDYMF